MPNFRTSKHLIAASKESTIQPYGSKWTWWAGRNWCHSMFIEWTNNSKNLSIIGQRFSLLDEYLIISMGFWGQTKTVQCTRYTVPDGLNWLAYNSVSSKSHFDISISCIFAIPSSIKYSRVWNRRIPWNKQSHNSYLFQK